jgi:ribosomal protein S16
MKSLIIKFKKRNKHNSKILYILVMMKKKNIEKLGFLNLNRPKIFAINLMRLGFWLNRGAFMQKTIKKYLIKILYIKNDLF